MRSHRSNSTVWNVDGWKSESSEKMSQPHIFKVSHIVIKVTLNTAIQISEFSGEVCKCDHLQRRSDIRRLWSAPEWTRPYITNWEHLQHNENHKSEKARGLASKLNSFQEMVVERIQTRFGKKCSYIIVSSNPETTTISRKVKAILFRIIHFI